MPVGFGDGVSETWAPLDGELTEGDEYSITITPDSESYVVYVADGQQAFGEKGAPVTISRTVSTSTTGLSFGVSAAVVRNPEERPPSVENLATLDVSVKTNIN